MYGQSTRREFIQNGLTFVSLSLGMPAVLMRTAQAADVGTTNTGKKNKVLVVIEMSGGNDGLNTVIPYADPGYAKARPVIGLPANSVHKLSNTIGLHPSMGAMKTMFDKGNLAVITGVGYPNPNRSHFFSMDVWQSGDPTGDIHNRSGWLARYFDDDGHFKGDPLSGVTLGSALPLAMTSGMAPVSVIGNGRDYGFRAFGGDTQRQLTAIESMYSQGTIAANNADFVRNVGNEAYASTVELKRAIKDYDVHANNTAIYPTNNGLADGLHSVAKLITGGVSTRVYYLSIGGFDTHANQPGGHAYLLGQIADAVSAFFEDLGAQGRADDVTLMTFSEFGRRVKENSSAGTDHGAASVMFLAGAGIKGGIYGDYPSLADLDDGDLRFHTDFRSVYATLLDNWLGTKSAPVLGGNFTHMNFLA